MEKSAWASIKWNKDFLATMRAHKQKAKAEDGDEIKETLPNRRTLRRNGINVTRRSGRPFARIPSGARLAPSSLSSSVTIRQRVVDEKGRVIKTTSMTVPRETYSGPNEQ